MNSSDLNRKMGSANIKKLFNNNLKMQYLLNPMTHFSKPTQENLLSQSLILQRLSNPKIYFIAFLPRVLMCISREILLYILKKHTLRKFNTSTVHNKSIIFVSHLIQNNGNSSNSDLFFGGLPFVSNANKVGNLILLIDHTNSSFKSKPHQLLSEKYLTIPKTVNFLPLLKILKVQIVDLIDLVLQIRLGRRHKFNDLLIQLELALQQVSRKVFSDLYLAHNITIMCLALKASKIVLTLEGHSHEVQIANQLKKEIDTLEVFFCVLTPIVSEQEGLYKNVKIISKIATICVTGKIIRDYILDRTNIDPKCIKILGSPKNRSQIPYSTTKSKRRNILFVPEGIESLASEMFEAAMYCALELPKVSIIYRPHPNYQGFLNENILNDTRFPVNFHFSDKKLSSELMNAMACVYRSSAVSIESLPYKLHQVHYKKVGYDLDPLDIANVKHFKADSLAVLVQYLHGIASNRYPISSKLHQKRITVYSELFSTLQSDFFALI